MNKACISILATLFSAHAIAQQVISSSTSGTVNATGGNITVNPGVTVGSSSASTTPIVVNGVDVPVLTNDGTLQTSTSNGTALNFNSTNSLAIIINNGSMTSKSGIQLQSAAAITNNGSMLGTDRGITVYSSASGSEITNNSALNAYTQSYAAISNQAGSTLTSVNNAAGATISGLVPIENNGVITTFTNSGTISSRHWVPSSAIGGSGSIVNLINYGTLRPASTGSAVSNTVINLANAQGGNAPLTISNQPTNYSIIVNSPTSYGRLSVLSSNAPMAFSVYSGSNITTGYYYTSVLAGITASGLGNTSGIYNGTSWALSLASGSLNTWNLCFGSGTCSYTLSTNILAGSTYLASNLGGSVNPAFEGGRLRVSSSGIIAPSFTISNANGTIDQNALASRFTGVISDAITGAAGKLIIANSGTAQQGKVILSGANTYTGGTDVESGAVLSIGSASALGSGALNLVGSATIPATLETTQTMTISNPITVTGDPVFSVASGTTTTVSSPITDGSSAGDVVVGGGGTLNLTAVNTYTGPTTVDAGSTLALSGSGSITPSSAVINNGTFDLSNATSTVNLGGSFTQSGTGSLNMGASAGAFQKVVIAGTASLGGSLGLTAAAGNYRIGRYTLLNAGSVTGTFSSFKNNLASVTPLGYLLSYDASNVYLNLAPNASATYQGIQQNSQALGSVINMQAAALQAGLSYDCAQYDENNLCVSVGGRYTYAGTGPSGNAQSGLVIVGYRPTLSTRIGAFADQSVNISTPNNISQSKTSPMWGLFSTWQKNKDGNGLSVQGSAAVAASELTINRTASSITESGSGKTQFDGQAYQVQANYAQPVTDATKLVPYLGLRYTRINQGGYTESSNAQTLYPVNYNAMAQNTFSAIGGVGVQSHLAEKLKGTVTAGLQQNLNYSMGNYAGTSTIPGMTTFSAQMPGNTNTMATASGGLYYSVRKNEQIGLTALWQQQPFINTNTTSVIATYTIGL